MHARFLGALVGCASLALAQSAPQLTVDVSANRHAISPDIYGINDYSDTGLADMMRVGVRRWGGDATSRYNWQNDVYNSAGDWYFQNQPYQDTNVGALPDNSTFDQFVETGLTTATKRLGTIPVLGWLPASRNQACGFSVAKYGPQQQADPYESDCGNGKHTDGSNVTGNDPHDTSSQFDPSFQQQWIQHLVSKYGSGTRGGVQVWSLDNEPEWWFGVHMDIHPNPATYDEMLSVGQTYASAIKAADPTALVTGPVSAGWYGYFYSALDFVNGWMTPPYNFDSNPVDYKAHGSVPFIEWYLQQMQSYEQQHGTRLLDYVDLHAYLAPDGIAFGEAGDDATNTLRLTSTRVFWDPNYTQPQTGNQAAYIIPRMEQWVAGNYPGTKTAITEYNWGALDDITGAIAQADILGIFGREGLDLGAMWGPPDVSKNQPAVYAFGIFLNYDGFGNQFGETSVSATTGNPDQLSIFAAQRSDNALTVVVLNKTTGDLATTLNIANFNGSPSAQVWQYSAANLQSIIRVSDAPLASGTISYTYPARSITLLVVPPSDASLPVSKPVIKAIANSASYDAHAISPGEIIIIGGTNLAPEGLRTAQVTPDRGYLTQTLNTVRVLVNGVPAPMVYTSPAQLSAIVPYQISLVSTAQLQVEVQGVRSDPFTASLAPAVPALFTHDASGSGQGAILNQDYSVNSAANAANPGDFVLLYATGEGVTSPPGVDGRLALDILPKPTQSCAVTIGGQTADVVYCGAAPDFTSGLMQINARVPSGISPGNAVVSVSIGGVASQSNVTVAIK